MSTTDAVKKLKSKFADKRFRENDEGHLHHGQPAHHAHQQSPHHRWEKSPQPREKDRRGNVKVNVHLLWDYANVRAPGSLLQDIRRTVEAAERQVECIVQPTVFVVNGVTPQAEIDDLRKYGCLIISCSMKREDADRNLVNRLTELTTTHQITSATPIVIVSGDQDFVEHAIESRGTHKCSVYVFSNATKGSDNARRLEFGCTKHFHVADISARTSSPPVAASTLCVHYQKGTCKFGDRCKKAHVISAGHGQ